MRCIAVAGLLAMFAFSIFRGTDKEMFDVAILQVAALGVVCCRYVANRKAMPAARVWLAAVVILLMVSLMLNSFVDRKAQRIGFQAEQRVEQGTKPEVAMAPAYCISSRICTYPLAAGADLNQVRFNFAFSMVSAYLAQGYYGLALSFEKPFESMYGFGHSNLLTRAYVAVTKDQTFANRALTTRLGDDGWDVRYQWSSAYTWFANDVGVWGSALVVGGLAFLWGLSWKDALFGENDAAAVVFCLLCWFFVYLPASNEIMQTADGYFALLSWLGIWLLGRFRHPRLSSSASVVG